MAKRGRPRVLNVPFRELLPRLRRILGPTNRTDVGASRRAGAQAKARARLTRAFRDFDAGHS